MKSTNLYANTANFIKNFIFSRLVLGSYFGCENSGSYENGRMVYSKSLHASIQSKFLKLFSQFLFHVCIAKILSANIHILKKNQAEGMSWLLCSVPAAPPTIPTGGPGRGRRVVLGCSFAELADTEPKNRMTEKKMM